MGSNPSSSLSSVSFTIPFLTIICNTLKHNILNAYSVLGAVQGVDGSVVKKREIVHPHRVYASWGRQILNKHPNKDITAICHKHLKTKIINRKIGEIFVRLGRVL